MATHLIEMDICIFIPVRTTVVSQFWLIKPSYKTYPSVINKNKDCSLSANESYSGICCFAPLGLLEQLHCVLQCRGLGDRPCASFFFARSELGQGCRLALLPARTTRYTAARARERTARVALQISTVLRARYASISFPSMLWEHRPTSCL